jgi:amino acid transporter
MSGPDTLQLVLLLVSVLLVFPALVLTLLVYFFRYRKLPESPNRTFLYSFGGKSLVFGIFLVFMLVVWGVVILGYNN